MKNRRKFTARQRVQIVLEGLQSDASVAEVCRRHQISTTLYYRWGASGGACGGRVTRGRWIGNVAEPEPSNGTRE